jgi:inorganic pyrophosphatase
MLFSSVHDPCDYRFIPDTLAEVGDLLDALVLLWAPTFPGCLIDVHSVGMLRMKDEKGSDEKVLCVPTNDPLWNFIKSLDAVPTHLLKEIDNFFSVDKDLEAKKTKTKGWEDLAETLKGIQTCRQRFSTVRAVTAGCSSR